MNVTTNCFNKHYFKINIKIKIIEINTHDYLSFFAIIKDKKLIASNKRYILIINTFSYQSIREIDYN